ncbi:glycosyltransferase family 4 protein [Halobacterium salinarum]|uniref:glycosyltransferase family 4 protein n=1 Tax=Halobacterium salinarum TaxID=2242 RepID=UPI002552611F|nr:glycosyltransferase family 4 protein [Halobacterium salinarum]MDL0121114.1 glycosyltransferase family 4 protein [Halobacterium salinarum]MDL0135795.1 glycosyltransferase family 4 protein [Halobacterium salinarum]MDL0138285.1 glycosyltransferase family 4 protein [Halobacterium salinarum]
MDAVHLTTAHNSTDTRIFDKEATSLAEAGFDVSILAHDTPEEERNGVQFIDLGSAPSRIDRWRSIPKATRIAKQLEASIYHFHDPELIPVGLYLAETTDGAVVYDVHEDYGHKAAGREWVPNLVTPPIAYTIPRVERLAAGRFDALVSATDRLGKRFVQSNDRGTTLHNFPRIDSLPSKMEARERQADYVLCYVGGLSELRGIHRSLDLVNTLRSRGLDVELWALGSWRTDADERRADQFICNHNLESSVEFPGYVEYKEMFRYLYGADVGLSLLDTAEFETAIPTKQFEYLYAGLPTLTTPLDAAIRYLPDRFRHVVPQDDTEAAADVVETALKCDYDAENMRSLVEEQYSWEHEAEKLVDLYEELLKE